MVMLKIGMLKAYTSVNVITLYFNSKSRRANTFFNIGDLILR